MGFWFGRKGAPEMPSCAYGPPAWLVAAEEAGFVRSVEGLSALVKASGTIAVFRAGAWEIGTMRGEQLILGGNQVVGGRLAAVADPSGGTVVDSEARAAVAAILARLRAHGLIAS